MCQKCDVRDLFGDGPCNQCKINSALKSASIRKQEENSNKKPYWISLYEMQFGGIE